jgi:hypothetical protein
MPSFMKKNQIQSHTLFQKLTNQGRVFGQKNASHIFHRSPISNIESPNQEQKRNQLER